MFMLYVLGFVVFFFLNQEINDFTTISGVLMCRWVDGVGVERTSADLLRVESWSVLHVRDTVGVPRRDHVTGPYQLEHRQT